MATMPVNFPPTEGVLLIRKDGVVMAVHLVSVTVVMEPIFNEPDIRHAAIYFIPALTLDHYEVEAHGQADKLTIWTGPDPFAKPELDAPEHDHRMGVTCPVCGHQTPRRAVLA